MDRIEEYFEAVKAICAGRLQVALRREEMRRREENASEEEAREEEAQMVRIEALEAALFEKGRQFSEEEIFLPAEYLFQMFDCNAFQRHCVLMALCYEMDENFAKGIALLNERDCTEGLNPSIAVKTWLKEIEYSEIYRTFHSSSVLMQMFFQPVSSYPSESAKPLRLNRRILDFLFGRLEENPALKPFVTRYRPEKEAGFLTENQPALETLLPQGAFAVELTGPKGVGKHFCIRNYCSRRGRIAYFITVNQAFRDEAEQGLLFDEIKRECSLFQGIPVLVIPEEEPEEKNFISALFSFVEGLLEVTEPVFFLDEKPLPHELWENSSPWLWFEIPDMSLTEKRRIWKREAGVYPLEAGVNAEEMANLFPLTYGGILSALENAFWRAKSQGREEISREDLQRGCYLLFPVHLRTQAIPIPAVYTWDDLILPKYQKDLLTAACCQVRYKHRIYEDWGFAEKIPYGRGVSMIFAGSPGTGKTMAAQVFAGELGMDLYKIELSAVVSKFVGETEKNLNRIFEQAKRSRVILFFDEADVLFGKRTEVKDANDKYSNMEAAFLLQKMEEYEGVTILATNLIQNFDEAFKRRVKFMIDFPFPDARDRRNLWRKSMPAAMEREELDLDYLAERFELSGSNIRNIVLHAAFLAAAEGSGVGMGHILKGIRNEYAKSGKTLTKKDVGEYYVLLPELDV